MNILYFIWQLSLTFRPWSVLLLLYPNDDCTIFNTISLIIYNVLSSDSYSLSNISCRIIFLHILSRAISNQSGGKSPSSLRICVLIVLPLTHVLSHATSPLPRPARNPVVEALAVTGVGGLSKALVKIQKMCSMTAARPRLLLWHADGSGVTGSRPDPWVHVKGDG